MIYEMRFYDTGGYDRQKVVVEAMEKFMAVFDRAGIKVIGLWTTVIGLSGEFVYLLQYDSLADREQKWGKLASDPETRRIITESGWSTNSERNVILRPTSYSPLK